ncbi:lysophospholipase [Herpetosiphon llansteffanensis]
MEHTTATFTGVHNTTIFYQTWRPATPKATVVVVHGYAEHSGRYQHVAEALVAANYSVWALDHRGHGQSQGNRATVKHFEEFVNDLASFVRLVRDKEPNGPLFMLGHSMGGLISTLYTLEYGHNLHGLVLTGPAFKVDAKTPKAVVKVGAFISKFLPQLPVAPFDPQWNSRDPKVVEAFKADALNYKGGIKAQMGTSMITATRIIDQRAGEISLPVLMLQGLDDRLVSPEAAIHAFGLFKSQDKTLHTYPGLYHEVLNEPEQTTLIPLIVEWLDAHIA